MLRLRLFGEPALLDDIGTGAARPWRPHVALLARLALAPAGILSRATLVGMLWPEVPERNARASLRQALFRLRRDLGEVVVPAGEMLYLDGQRIEVDVCEFERLLDLGHPAEALAHYSGEFLSGFSLPSSAAFDEWTDRERMRLAGRAAAACAELVERAAGSGEWMEAIRWAEQWLTLDPCSEAAAARLLALRAQSGDVGGALAFYEGFCLRLQSELALSPGAELAALVERIRRSPPPPSLAPVPRSSRSPSPPPLPLVGRESEFARLRARWESAAAGRRQLVLLTGEPGIGKTRLAREFASWMQRGGATTLYGRAYEVEQGVPYAALTGVLRAALDAPGLAGVDAASLGELSRIVPEIATRFRSGVAPTANDLEAGRVRLLEAVRSLFENLAFEAPVLLLLDDLPWADGATLTALHYLWRRLPDAPLLLLATARAADISTNGALERMLGAASREAPQEVERIPLAPLGTGEIARLAAEAGIAATGTEEGEPLAAVLARESGGNPLFLIEALRARLEGSESPAAREGVRVAVAELTADLTPPTRQLLQAAAALGRHFPLPLAAAVAALPHPEAIGALEVLLAQRLLQRVDYEYDFVHDLLRQSVYGGLSPERRRLLHRSAYERLAPGEGEEVGLERAGALAMHAVQGELVTAAHHWLLRAAELAKAVFAGAEAERFLAQAAGFATSAAEHRAVWERIGDLRRAQSRFGAAALAFHHALGHTESGSTVRLGLRIKLLDASLRSGVLRLPDADAAIATLIADAGEAGSAFLRDAHRVAGSAYLQAGDLARAEEHALRTLDAARSVEDPGALVRALLLRAQAGTLRRTLPDALPVLGEAVRIAAEHGLMCELCDAETEYATELCRLGEWTPAIAGWERALRHGKAAGALGAVAVAHLNLADLLLRRGAWEKASGHLENAWTLSERFDFPHILVDVLVNRALLAWQRGDGEEVREPAQRALEQAAGQGMAAAERAARALLALALLEEGATEEALRVLDASPEPAEQKHPTWSDDHELIVTARARLLMHQRDSAAAARLLTAALEEATEPYATALLELELARLLREEDPAAAQRLARDASTILARLGAQPLLLRAECLLTDIADPTTTAAERRSQWLLSAPSPPGGSRSAAAR